ncbi:MAG: helix-turn-helix transcriptional regulator [Planctomycetota bacterium]
MSVTQALSKRIREMRRRHFGARGAAEFAQRLDLPLEQYKRFERQTVPPGEIMVRMCEVTGEDLQWLLTGVAARGTVVISGTRARHQELLTKVVRLLEEYPTSASALESFVDLLEVGERTRTTAQQQLTAPVPRHLIPIFDSHELPRRLTEPENDAEQVAFPLLLPEIALTVSRRQTARLVEPAGEYDQAVFHQVELVTVESPDGPARQYVHSPEIVECFPGLFGVRMPDNTMSPMCNAGDTLIVSVQNQPRPGLPALCRLDAEPGMCCRIWLDADDERVQLGRIANGDMETIARADICWALEVLYRLAPAA